MQPYPHDPLGFGASSEFVIKDQRSEGGKRRRRRSQATIDNFTRSNVLRFPRRQSCRSENVPLTASASATAATINVSPLPRRALLRDAVIVRQIEGPYRSPPWRF